MISVILPVYNGEKYLREAIESVLNQTFTNFELIIINDGSKDSSEKIIQEFTDQRIRYFAQENAGLIVTLNKGISLAKYEYIIRMDADDICMPQRFEKQISFLEKHLQVGIVGGQTDILDQKNNKNRKGIYPVTTEDVRMFAELGSPVAHPAVMFRKSIIERVGGYRSVFKHSEDYDLWLRVLDQAEIANLKDTVLIYREHETNISKVFAQQQMLGTIAARVSRYLRKNGLADLGKEDFSETRLLQICDKHKIANEQLCLAFMVLKVHGDVSLAKFLRYLWIAKKQDKGMFVIHELVSLYKKESSVRLQIRYRFWLAIAATLFPKDFFQKTVRAIFNRLV